VNRLVGLKELMKYPKVTFYGPAVIGENVEIGDGTGIGEYCVILRNIKIGKNCIIIYHVTIPKGTVIGDNVFIGPNTSLLDDKYPPTHANTPPTIEDDVIIGGGVTILPDITIHKGAVIGGGSVVIRDIPSNEVWAGNPAKFLMTREEYDKKRGNIDVLKG